MNLSFEVCGGSTGVGAFVADFMDYSCVLEPVIEGGTLVWRWSVLGPDGDALADGTTATSDQGQNALVESVYSVRTGIGTLKP